MYVIVLTAVEGGMLGVRSGEEVGEARLVIGGFPSLPEAEDWLEEKGCYKHPDEPPNVWCEARRNRERGRSSERNDWSRRLIIVQMRNPHEVWK